jgi:hypothetical protein
MMMFTVAMAVMVAMAIAICAALGLEGCLDFREFCSEALEHFLDHMVGPNAKDMVANFRRQMPIAEMPSQTCELVRIFVPDLYNRFRGGLNLEPPAVFELQPVSVGHGNRFLKIEKDIFTLVRRQANAPAMSRVKIESESSCCFFFRPVPRGAMNRSVLHGHPQYMK